MSISEPILIPFNGRSPVPTQRYFDHDHRSTPPTDESVLVKAIRSALRGSQGESGPNAITSLIFSSADSCLDEEELCWDNYTLILSSGGIIRKKWSFKHEGQPIQWACAGWFEQPSTLANPSSARSAHYTSSDEQDESVLPDPSQRPTFGPFTHVEREKRPEKETSTRFRAVFVFLRSLGKIFFMNGLEFTFYLPFIVRQAWPLAPHGVILQRLLEPGELEEAAVSKDEPLPTIFAMVDPFAEASAVGFTASIKNGRPSVLDDHDPSKPIASLPAQEHLAWVSSRAADGVEQIAITINAENNVLSVWRYAFLSPKDTPELPHRPGVAPRGSTAHSKHPRQSLSLSGAHPLSPRLAQPPQPFTSLMPDQPPLGALPGMPPALNATVPMAAIVPGAVPSVPSISAARPAPRGRRNSLGQHDVGGGATLGGRIEGSMLNVDPVDSARMRPAYWMEKLYSEEIVAAE